MGQIMQNVTTLLMATFPGTPVYPCMGNEDVYPVWLHWRSVRLMCLSGLPDGAELERNLARLPCCRAVGGRVPAGWHGQRQRHIRVRWLLSCRGPWRGPPCDCDQHKYLSVNAAHLTSLVADWWATLNNETSCSAEPDPNGGLAWLEAQMQQAAAQGGPIWIIGSGQC
jgi:hypothetical protein